MQNTAMGEEKRAMQLADMQAKVGEVVGTSDWLVIDQARIDAFAECTEDRQFIHVNPEMAKLTPFGGTIAHGFLTLSMLSAMAETGLPRPAVQMSVNYGFDTLRFLTPVKSGQRVRGVFTLAALVEKRPGQWQQKLAVTVEIEGGDKPALVAEWLIQHFA